MTENEELKVAISKKETTTEKNSEVEELKAKLKGFENGDVAWQGDMDATIKQNLELKAQIEQLKKQYKKQRNRRLDELQKENAELKAQIEKMKCCGNCKKRNSCIKHNSFVYPEMTNPINYNCYDLDKWEMWK